MRRIGWTVATACAAAVAIGAVSQRAAMVTATRTARRRPASHRRKTGDSSSLGANSFRGSYVFSATGFNIVGGVPQPKAIVEVIAFNGDGTLDVPAATVSLNGLIIRSFAGSGTYTVEDDCSGTVTFNGPAYDIFLSPDGDDISMIQTNPNTVSQGLATRISRRVRAFNQD